MAASVSHGTILVEHDNKLVEVLRGDSLKTTIRSALLDFVLQDDARDFEFKRLVGEVEATVGESVFAAMKGREGFRVRLVRKGAKSLPPRDEAQEQELLVTMRKELRELVDRVHAADRLREDKLQDSENRKRPRVDDMNDEEFFAYQRARLGLPAEEAMPPVANHNANTIANRQVINEQNQRTIDGHLARLRHEEATQEALERQDTLKAQEAVIEALTAANAVKKEPDTSLTQSHVTITIQQNGGSEYVFKARKTTLMEKIYRAIAQQTNLCESDFTLTSDDCRRLNPRSTVEESEIEDGDILYMYMQQKGGKPVIYLLPPSPLAKVSVKLSLIPQWEFSAIYPVVSASSANGQQHIEWTVSAEPGGMLVNQADQQPTPYLYWEALTTGKATTSSLAFNPSAASLDPSNSLLLSLEEVVPHLQKTLTALSLNVQARTDFITYWLPSLNKHKHVALRFLPQDEYETAAPISVDPKPDVVTRVFMLFKGIKEDDLGAWRGGKSLNWKEVVGLTAAAEDEKVFRVLEWGGMEVKA